MKFQLCVSGALLISASYFAPLATAQSTFSKPAEPAASATPVVTDGSDVDKQLAERQEKIGALTTEEQLQLRAAQLKAGEDKDVIAALKKRDESIEEFRQTFRNAMIKVDPKVRAILDKIAVGNSPGF